MSWQTMQIPQATDEHFSSPVHPSASGCGFPIWVKQNTGHTIEAGYEL